MKRSQHSFRSNRSLRVVHGFAALALAWVASLVPVFGTAACGLEFHLTDQFGVEKTQDDVAGQVTILIGGNRKASEHSRDWALAIQSLLETRTDQIEEIALLRIADLRGIPRILAPAVATQLGKKYERSVLMDWMANSRVRTTSPPGWPMWSSSTAKGEWSIR